jgi:hypothetical protein
MASTFQAAAPLDPALRKPRMVPMGPARLQIANRLNGAAKARKLALLLTTKPLKFGKP